MTNRKPAITFAVFALLSALILAVSRPGLPGVPVWLAVHLLADLGLVRAAQLALPRCGRCGRRSYGRMRTYRIEYPGWAERSCGGCLSHEEQELVRS